MKKYAIVLILISKLKTKEAYMKNMYRGFVVAIALLFFILNGQALLAISGAQEVSELKDIVVQKTGTELQVNVKIQGKFSFEIFELQKPNRLIVDFSSIEKISSEPTIQINDFGVLSVRAGQFQPKVARLVFDLDEKTPLHRISQVEDGLKIIFWHEEAAAQAEPPAAVEEAKKEEPAPQAIMAEVKEPEKKETLKEATKKEEAREKIEQPKKDVMEGLEEEGKSFFIKVGGGVGLPLSPTTSIQKDLSLYGETGALKQSYKLGTGLLVDLNFGKYIGFGLNYLQVGLGFEYYDFKNTETVEMSLPHPFIPNSPRTVSFTGDLKNKLYNFYLYGLYPLVGADKYSIGVGPVIGFASGKYSSLADFSLEENAPFGSADVAITSKTYTEDSISSIWFGGMASLEYLISPNIALNLDCRVILLSPNIKNLAANAKFSQAQFVLGIKYNF